MKKLSLSKNKLLNTLIAVFGSHIDDIDVTSETNAIRFSYDGKKIRVSLTILVEESKDGLLCSSKTTQYIDNLLRNKINKDNNNG